MKKKILAIILVIFSSFFLVSCKPERINGVIKSTAVVIEVQNDVRSLYVGETLQLNHMVYPENASQIVVWESNNTEVAEVNQNGLVSGKKSGRVKITATSDSVSDYVYLTIYDKPKESTSISIVGGSQVFVDEYIKLDYVLSPVGAVAEVIWTSNNEGIARVDGNGRVYGLLPGQATIEAKAGEISNSVNIEVLARSGNPTSITLKGRDILEVGSTMKLKVKTNPLGALNSVEFTSSDENILVVSEAGVVTAVSKGIALVTATSKVNNREAYFEIEVLDYNINLDNWLTVKEEVIEKTKNSIFGVANYQNTLIDDNYILTKYSIGSGVVYKIWYTLKDGSIVYNLDDFESFDDVETYHYYLVTNKHVVEGSDALKVYLHDIDEEIPATLIQYDTKVDIAVVYFAHNRYIRPLEFADVSNLKAGQDVIAIGNPSGFNFSSSATHGMVSHPQRYLPDDTDDDGVSDWDAEYIQHDAAINPGNSGGPLLNLEGKIIGINTLKFASNDIDNMGFSIPSSTVIPLLEILEKGEIPKRATLGVTSMLVKELLETPNPLYPIPEGVNFGLYVTAIIPGKAKEAGVKVGDIILTANGKELRNTIDIRLTLAEIIVGTDDELVLSVLRNGETLEFILRY